MIPLLLAPIPWALRRVRENHLKLLSELTAQRQPAQEQTPSAEALGEEISDTAAGPSVEAGMPVSPEQVAARLTGPDWTSSGWVANIVGRILGEHEKTVAAFMLAEHLKY